MPPTLLRSRARRARRALAVAAAVTGLGLLASSASAATSSGAAGAAGPGAPTTSTAPPAAAAGAPADASPAGAVPTVLLDPARVDLTLVPAEAVGGLDGGTDPAGGLPEATPVPVRYGGAVAVVLPDVLDDGAGAVAELTVPAADGAQPAEVFSSASTDPATSLPLMVDADGRYVVQLPDAGRGRGALAQLRLTGVGVQDPGAVPPPTLTHPLRLSAGGPPEVQLRPLLRASSQVPGAALVAGSAVDLVLPAGSPLSSPQGLRIPSLARAGVELLPLGADGEPVEAAAVELPPAAGEDARTASVLVPTATAAGSYLLRVALSADASRLTSVTTAQVEVAAPAAVAVSAEPTGTGGAPAVGLNPGLRSNTGWGEPGSAGAGGTTARPAHARATGGPASPLALTGAGAVTAAGLLAAAALRPGRRVRLRS